ncbi:MAG TPA: thiamine phosphate synthase [Stellaceae bacterium]|nr:thiamine phosphate synthase [Stellaceae bacterium]
MSRVRLPRPPFLVISDRAQARLPLEAVARAVFAGGCRWFSLREKDLPPAERLALLARLVAIGEGFDALVGVHADVAAAEAAGAGAVHLPAGGSIAQARARLPRALIGASAHSAAEAAALLAAGADYVSLSPVFVSPSKPGYGPALGIEGLARAAALGLGPIVALGGIGAANAALCLAAGASGVAVMGEAMRAADPRSAVRHILDSLESGAERLK